MHFTLKVVVLARTHKTKPPSTRHGGFNWSVLKVSKL